MMQLRIYSVALDVARRMSGVATTIGRYDRKLADQLRRASTSMVLGIAEGSSSRRGNKTLRYSESLGSAQEALACLEIAVAVGYIDRVDEGLADDVDRVIATMWKLAMRAK